MSTEIIGLSTRSGTDLRGSLSRIALLAATLAGITACPGDDAEEDNVLPSGSGTTGGGDETTDASATSVAATEGMETEGGAGFPAAFRFDCIDIQMLGTQDGDGFQAQLLEDTWGGDIDDFKLNIVLEVMERDDAGGTATIGIRSGVGTAPGDLCGEASTVGESFSVDFQAETTTYGPSSAEGECSTMQTGTGDGTYTLSQGPDFVAYIYAEDDDGTTFNCTPDQATPDAVPIRAVSAEVSADSSQTNLSGLLNACLLRTEAQNLCSCLGQCTGAMGPDDLQTEGECAGCPVGAVTLDALLGDIEPSDNCTQLMGAEAYDLQIGFTATRLPDVPATCG